MEYLTKLIVCLVLISFSGYIVWYLYSSNISSDMQVFAKVETNTSGFDIAILRQNIIRNSSELIKHINSTSGLSPPQKPVTRSVHVVIICVHEKGFPNYTRNIISDMPL